MISKYTQLSPTVWVRDLEWGKERFRGEGRLNSDDPYPRTFRSRCRLELTENRLKVHAEYPYGDVLRDGAWEFPAQMTLPKYSGKTSDGSRGSIDYVGEYLGTLPIRIELQGNLEKLTDQAREHLFDKAYRHFCLSTFKARAFQWGYLIKRCSIPYLYWLLSFLTGLSKEDSSVRERMDKAKERVLRYSARSSQYNTGVEESPDTENTPPSGQLESGPFSISTPAMLILVLVYGILWVKEAPHYTLSALFFSRDNKGVPLPLDTPWLILAGLLHILLGKKVITLLFRSLNPSDTLHLTMRV